jgi:hypothetical protein
MTYVPPAPAAQTERELTGLTQIKSWAVPLCCSVSFGSKGAVPIRLPIVAKTAKSQANSEILDINRLLGRSIFGTEECIKYVNETVNRVVCGIRPMPHHDGRCLFLNEIKRCSCRNRPGLLHCGHQGFSYVLASF